jgi:hypothetical protein
MNVTAAASTMPIMLRISLSGGETRIHAKMLPGEGGPFSVSCHTWAHSTPVAPPTMAAMIRIGFISTYGK